MVRCPECGREVSVQNGAYQRHRQGECPHERPKPRPDLAVYRKGSWFVIERDTGKVLCKAMNRPCLYKWMDRHNISQIPRF